MKAYPAKLLLFGEHTVNAGSQALAIPLPMFSGRWEYLPGLGKAALAKRQQQLPAFAAYLHRLQEKGSLICPVDVAAFGEALHHGLVFTSNIPTGYGAGSSGALVAAVAGEWSKGGMGFSPHNLLELRDGLAQMESFFHGTSSGTDPLICLVQKPLLLGGLAGARAVDLPDKKPVLFLLDTGIERQATPLIQYFLEQMKSTSFAGLCKSELLPAVDSAIAAFLHGDDAGLFGAFHRIGAFQFQYLPGLIPPSFLRMWQEGLEGGLFKLKVCGAGGGGFVLGITGDFEKLQAEHPGYKWLGLW
ncbi:MAG: hypothetical protein R2830_10365 [Saprospiraceae bacterium]